MERGKYAALLDDDIWAFIDRTNAWYPPEATGFTIAKQRAVYDAMCLAFRAGYPAGIRALDGMIEAAGRSLPIRHYVKDGRAPRASIVYYHGGGFVLGGLESHDDVCAELCAGTGYDVVSVDYRLAPEHVHPAAFDDACAAFDWAADTFDLPIVLAGESAGGNLAAAVAHARRGHRRLVGQILIYPDLGGDLNGRSYREHADAPLLATRDVQYYRDIRIGARPPVAQWTVAPLRDDNVAGLPPTVIVTAQCDPLSSDGEVYRDRIVAAGGRAWWREEPGLVHSFVRARHSAKRAGDGFARAVSAAAALGAGAWPF